MAEPIHRDRGDGDDAEDKCMKTTYSKVHAIMEGSETLSRKEKRKTIKKMKRKQMRREMAKKKREEEEAELNDPEEQRRIELMEREESERIERERKEFEDRERAWNAAIVRKKKEQEEEDERRKALEESQRQQEIASGDEHGKDENDEWDYIEEGPAEIIWQGNEIIVKKKRVRVPKKDLELRRSKEDANRPTSNPLPPESEAFTEFNKSSMHSAQQLLENVSQQVPNFGTEQDKAHCPFHLKTGTCRFGQRCSRVHFYPDRSCTILIKNMYNGPGLAWEQDEGLEHTEEEVERSYEEFYEDVHTEFLKYGEIVNFKVCRNGSSHLRGNVYVHYKSLDSAMAAYRSANGRFFAGKQVTCEYVNVTRWKIAICGEYMKSRYKTCSHGGIACNFVHCFRNPGGDYEWADWDKPPPRYWVKEMAALFGDDYGFENSGSSSRISRRNTPPPPPPPPDYFNSRRRRRKRERKSESRGHGGTDDDEQRIIRRRRHKDDDDPKDEEKNSKYSHRMHSHNKRSMINHGGSDDDNVPREDYGDRRHKHHHNNNKSIETSSSKRRCKISQHHNKSHGYYSGEEEEGHDGDGRKKKKQQRGEEHSNSRHSDKKEEYTTHEGCDHDTDSSVERDSYYGGEDRRHRKRRKSRSNLIKTIDMHDDRWDPE